MLWRNHVYFYVSTASADGLALLSASGLALLSARTSAGTVMTKSGHLQAVKTKTSSCITVGKKIKYVLIFMVILWHWHATRWQFRSNYINPITDKIIVISEEKRKWPEAHIKFSQSAALLAAMQVKWNSPINIAIKIPLMQAVPGCYTAYA